MTHEGNKILAAQHLCLGDSSDPKYYLRIHFAPLGDKVIVAHCGRHLRTKSHN